jgi:restriction system protein
MSKAEDMTVWGIHGGRTGDADSLFLKSSRVALRWDELGDLSILPADRDAFKNKVAECYPQKKPAAIPNNAGQLFRFVHEMQAGDFIVYPSKIDKEMHIGRIESGYQYDAKKEPGYPHQRIVKWLRSVPRTHFSQGALYETGSAMSFFQIKNFADEFRQAIESGKTSPVQEDEPETVAHITEDIEANTRDYILKRLGKTLKGHPLAAFVAQLMAAMGYRTRLSPVGKDGGIDIVAHRDELGFEPPIIKVQVKSSDGTVGAPVVTALYGNVGADEYGLFVTLGTFSPDAKNFARGKSNLRLIDGEELVSLILSHYEEFDSHYKGLLPLKKVYVPEALEESAQ